MKSFLIIFLFLFSFKIHSQVNCILQGKIGEYPIIMNVSEGEGSAIKVRYFYKKYLKDIFLKGYIKKNNVIFSKYISDEKSGKDILKEKFFLTINQNKIWNGKWKSGKIELPVSIKQIDTNQIKIDPKNELIFNTENDRFYDYLRSQNIIYTKTQTTQLKQLKLEWFTEKNSGIKSFQIIDGINNKKNLNSVNQILRKEHEKNILAFFDCANNSFNHHDGFDYFFDSVYLNNNILGVDIRVFSICGGAHPNTFNDYININLTSGKEVNELSDLYQFNKDDSSFLNEMKNDNLLDDEVISNINLNDKIIDYKSSYFIYKIFNKLYSKEIKLDKDSGDCLYYDFEKWRYFDFIFKNEGVYICPSVPHVINQCGYPEWSILPYSILNGYLKKWNK